MLCNRDLVPAWVPVHLRIVLLHLWAPQTPIDSRCSSVQGSTAKAQDGRGLIDRSLRSLSYRTRGRSGPSRCR